MKLLTITLSLCLGSIANAALTVPARSAPIKIANATAPLFTDVKGHQRIMRGTNVVYKKSPYYPELDSAKAVPGTYNSFTQDDINLLASMGINTIRLGALWIGGEPQRGQYNQTYIDQLSIIIQRCQDAGIYVLVDLHQDVYGPTVCGEGFPAWATQPYTSFLYPTIYSPLGGCDENNWSNNYNTQGVAASFERLYTNYDGLADALGTYFRTLVHNFKNFDNILGYELINEPWAGDHHANPTIMIPGVADIQKLQPFYNRLAPYIWNEDPTAMIFYEPVTWDQLNVGFSTPPGGWGKMHQTVLSTHYYSLKSHQGAQLFDLPKVTNAMFKFATNLGSGHMMTEWQQWGTDAASLSYQQSVAKLADDYLLSYHGWQYLEQAFRYQNGSANPAVVLPNSRPYVASVAGHSMSMAYDDGLGTFWLTFTDGGWVQDGVTEIRAPVFHYPKGLNVTINATGGSYKYDATNAGFVYILRAGPVTSASGAVVKVIITKL